MTIRKPASAGHLKEGVEEVCHWINLSLGCELKAFCHTQYGI